MPHRAPLRATDPVMARVCTALSGPERPATADLQTLRQTLT